MRQARKHLKITSIIILILAVATLMDIVAEILSMNLGDFAAEGFTEDILRITKIVVLAVSILCLLPQIYIGLKGLKIAKKSRFLESAYYRGNYTSRFFRNRNFRSSAFHCDGGFGD